MIFTKNSVENIKNILASSNVVTGENELQEIAEEIAESIKGLDDKDAIANTIHASLVSSGVSFKDVDDLMGVAENITSTM